MKFHKSVLSTSDVPEKLRNIPQPPKSLFVQGANLAELTARPCVAVVGSRRVTTYGKTVTLKLAEELTRAGVVIVSGLAIGVDGLAHRAALDAGGQGIAVLPGGLDNLYPAQHRGLAERLLAQGGALVSEYPEGAPIYTSNFIARNRLVSGLADALLITEAGLKSGTLHTARFALEQGRTVLAVPGSITSPTSVGTNNLIKAGATPVTCTADVLNALGLTPAAARAAPTSDDPHEQLLLDLLTQGLSNGAQLLAASQLEVSRFNQALTMLEIRGQIRPLGNNHWALY